MNPLSLYFHIGFSILGQVFLGIASILTFLHLFQERRLKNKKPLAGFLPPLEALDRTHYRLLVLGFSAFSIGIFIGSFWSQRIWTDTWLFEPKQLFSWAGWLFYALFLRARVVSGIRGRKAAYFGLVGIILLLFISFGVSFFFPGQHEGLTG